MKARTAARVGGVAIPELIASRSACTKAVEAEGIALEVVEGRAAGCGDLNMRTGGQATRE